MASIVLAGVAGANGNLRNVGDCLSCHSEPLSGVGSSTSVLSGGAGPGEEPVKAGIKWAVLGLVCTRRGYGYQLAQRFAALMGESYLLRSSAVYTALDQLAASGYVVVAERQAVGGSRRSPRTLYEVTPAGRDRFLTWIIDEDASTTEPVRSELVARIAFMRPEHAIPVLRMIDAAELECLDLIAGAQARAADLSAGDEWEQAIARLVHGHGTGIIEARLAWLREARATIQALLD